MNTVAMGSVYTDKGEGIEYLEAQMGRMAKQGLEQYFMDIICRPDQITEAMKLLSRFYELVADLMPLTKVYVGITCDINIRPATMALVVLTHTADISMKDINPDRKR